MIKGLYHAAIWVTFINILSVIFYENERGFFIFLVFFFGAFAAALKIGLMKKATKQKMAER